MKTLAVLVAGLIGLALSAVVMPLFVPRSHPDFELWLFGGMFGFSVVIGYGGKAVVTGIGDSSSFASSKFGRAIIGFLADTVLRYGIAFAAVVLLVRLLGLLGVNADNQLVWVALLGLFMAAWFALAAWVVRPALAALLHPLERLLRSLRMGRGGSAKFAGIISEWGMIHRPGALFLGTSLYNKKMRIGHEDDRGVITLASARSGKGRSGIIPNLLMWPHSALVIDPKGTNATVTAATRRRWPGSAGLDLWGRVRQEWREITDDREGYRFDDLAVVDPFRQTKGAATEYRARFNPLDVLNPASPQIAEDIGLIADALVVPEQGADHWDEGARTVISGVLAYLLKTKGPERISLSDVRRLVALPAEALVGELIQVPKDTDTAIDRMIKGAAYRLFSGSDEAESFLSSAQKNTRWLDSDVMRDVLSRSDFSLDWLKERPATIYLVLPPHLIGQHSRFLRLFINLSIRAMTQGGRARQPVLFLLDEFYALGTMKLLQEAAAALPSYGVKLWPIIQNIGQLKELYPRNWETFIANAGVRQVFGIADTETADYIGKLLGMHEIERRAPGIYGEQGMVERTVYQLRQAEELGQMTSRESAVQMVLRQGADPLLLRRANYDEMFDKDAFALDPDHAPPGHYYEGDWDDPYEGYVFSADGKAFVDRRRWEEARKRARGKEWWKGWFEQKQPISGAKSAGEQGRKAGQGAYSAGAQRTAGNGAANGFSFDPGAFGLRPEPAPPGTKRVPHHKAPERYSKAEALRMIRLAGAETASGSSSIKAQALASCCAAAMGRKKGLDFLGAGARDSSLPKATRALYIHAEQVGRGWVGG